MDGVAARIEGAAVEDGHLLVDIHPPLGQFVYEGRISSGIEEVDRADCISEPEHSHVCSAKRTIAVIYDGHTLAKQKCSEIGHVPRTQSRQGVWYARTARHAARYANAMRGYAFLETVNPRTASVHPNPNTGAGI